jgi:hypothetical protein
MAITTIDQLAAGFTPPNAFFKNAVASLTAGRWHSLWSVDGRPSAGATPAATPGAVPDNTTAGALPYNLPVGGRLTYLARLAAAAGVPGTLLVYDRLCHVASINGGLVGAQTVNSAALTRPDANGNGVEAWVEYFAAAVGTSTVSISYTNSLGVSGRTSPAVTLPATIAAGTMIPLPLAAGDTGVRSVQTITHAGASGGTNVGVTLLRQIAQIPLPAANINTVANAIELGMPLIQERVSPQQGACIAFALLLQSTSAGPLYGQAVLAQG